MIYGLGENVYAMLFAACPKSTGVRSDVKLICAPGSDAQSDDQKQVIASDLFMMTDWDDGGNEFQQVGFGFKLSVTANGSD